MPSRRLADHLGRGVLYNACSLHQLEEFGRVAPGREVAIRLNPGLGSGATNRTNTGGPASSFGIWHEYMDEVRRIAKQSSALASGPSTAISAPAPIPRSGSA